MERHIVIEHDNGMRGHRGFTDMTETEMLTEYGSVYALRASYESSGIHVYNVFSSVQWPTQPA